MVATGLETGIVKMAKDFNDEGNSIDNPTSTEKTDVEVDLIEKKVSNVEVTTNVRIDVYNQKV